MKRHSMQKLLGVRFVIAVFLVTFIGVPVLQLINGTSAAAATTYTWADSITIKSSGGDTYIRVTKDDAGRTLSIPNDEMILESLKTNANCGQTGADVNRDSSVFNPAPVVQSGNTTVNASFGVGDLIIVRPYATSNTATYVAFPNVVGETCAPRPTSISLQNRAGATWTDSQHITYLNQKFTYQSINGNAMVLNGSQGANDCSPETITIGDDTSGYMSATVATLTLNQYSEGAGGNRGSCQRSTVPLTMTNQYISPGIGTVGHWVPNALDPNAAIIIDNVGGDAQAYLKPGDTFLESSKNPISGQDMTLLYPSSCPTVADNTMHVNPYTSATTATIAAAQLNAQGCTKANLIVRLSTAYNSGSGPAAGGANPTTVSDGCNVPTTEQFRWFECPLITSLQGAANSINGLIASQLDVPDSLFFNDATQKVYSIFRNIGVAILVIAGLVMVVSQAADLELFAAHTVRKALPRIIIIAILISISWPLLKFTVDFFNDLGRWSGKIVLSITDYTYVKPNGGDFGAIMVNVGETLTLGLVAVGGIALLQAGGIISLLVSMMLFLLVGIVVLMIRKIIILLWILFTPIACAASAMDGDETKNVYEFWKDTGITALVMYPIISIFLAGGTALAYLILSVKSNDYGYRILAYLVFIVPYIALPFAFKLAGGLVGRVIEFAQGTHRQSVESRLQNYRQHQVAQHWDEQFGRHLTNQTTQARSRLSGSIKNWGSRGGIWRRPLASIGRSMIGGYNAEAQMSARSAALTKTISDQTSTGDDSEVRALTVNSRWARSQGALQASGTYGSGGGWSSNGWFRQNGQGERQYRTLGGGWVSEQNVNAAYARWGNDTFSQQAALAYEMGKASTEEEVQGVAQNFNNVADAWHMSDGRRDNAWIGAAFANQNKHLEYKRMKRDTATRQMALNYGGQGQLVDDIYENRGSYNLAQMGSNTIEELKRAYTAADSSTAPDAADRKMKIAAIAETFMHQYGNAAGIQQNQPGTGGALGGGRQASIPGAAHVAERVVELAKITGAYNAGPAGMYPGPGGTFRGHAPTPNRREQS